MNVRRLRFHGLGQLLWTLLGALVQPAASEAGPFAGWHLYGGPIRLRGDR